MAFLINVD